MILFPAIDLKDGKCVRLEKGLMEKATVFHDNPAAQAEAFAAEGFEWIHIVDLNGAFAGRPVNEAAVNAIRARVNVPLQLGGGIRDLGRIEHWLSLGITRVILGTAALKNPALVKEACQKFPGKIVVGIDAKGGFVAVEGWAETSNLRTEELAKQFEDCGVAAIIFTDIDRDGVLKGPNMEATQALAGAVNIPIIASGGVSSIEDLRALKALENEGVIGVISGRAIYDGRIDVAAALALMKEPA